MYPTFLAYLLNFEPVSTDRLSVAVWTKCVFVSDTFSVIDSWNLLDVEAGPLLTLTDLTHSEAGLRLQLFNLRT